jgi:hypothetical protein
MDKKRKKLKILCTVLVGTLVAGMVVAMGSIPGERTPKSMLVSGSIGNKALADPIDLSTDATNDINNDIHLEILEPYVVLPVPLQKYGGSKEMFIELAITNQGSSPIQIAGRGLVAQLVADDGTVLPLQKLKESLVWCSPLYRDETEELYADFNLSRFPNSRSVGLKIYDGTATEWSIQGISPGTYQLYYAYSSPSFLSAASTDSCPEKDDGEIESLLEIRTSQTAIDSVELRIVEPEEIDSNTLEIDGVRFEMLMSDRTLKIPENKTGASTKVEVGIRITNQTQTPLRFTGFDTLALSILKANGQPLERSKFLYWRPSPKETEVPLIQPGESTTFFLDAKLFWKYNQLRLGNSDGFDLRWYFNSLEADTYLFSMVYSRPKLLLVSDETNQPKILKDFWKGSGFTPFVEVRLVKP